jgi:hypothetical protein
MIVGHEATRLNSSYSIPTGNSLSGLSCGFSRRTCPEAFHERVERLPLPLILPCICCEALSILTSLWRADREPVDLKKAPSYTATPHPLFRRAISSVACPEAFHEG